MCNINGFKNDSAVIMRDLSMNAYFTRLIRNMHMNPREASQHEPSITANRELVTSAVTRVVSENCRRCKIRLPMRNGFAASLVCPKD